MRNALLTLVVLAGVFLPASALASAFEVHSSWHQEPQLETERGISLGQSVLEMGTGLRMISSDSFFNSNGNLQDATHQIDTIYWDLFWRHGFSENMTWWAHFPFIWSSWNKHAMPGASWEETASAEMEMGDANAGLLYQFYRSSDPTVSMGISLNWKLPTGSETPGRNDKNITGTGTTDVDISFLGRYQVMRYLALGWAAGYNLRLPGTTQYILDTHSSITNASLDLGDELYGQIDIIGALEWIAVQVSARYSYRFETQLAIPEFRMETVRYDNPQQIDPDTNEPEEIEAAYMLFNGASYEDWKVLDPTGLPVSTDGYQLTLTPRMILRPVNWLDLHVFATLHLMGKNSTYLTNYQGNNNSIDLFMPMQTLGKNLGGLVLGEVGVSTVVRW